MKPRLWLAIFMLLQLADGVLTYAAIERFGASAEGNPILATWIMHDRAQRRRWLARS